VNEGQYYTTSLALALSTHTRVQAVFNPAITVNVFTEDNATTPGTLRYALTTAQNGDVIILSGVTAGTTKIELGSALPEITKRLTIEGNGVTLTRAASWTASSQTSQLLRIPGSTTEVQIRRMHFKDGQATENGGAIYNTGLLTLESCIFSGNRTTSTGAYGGALYSENILSIRGCTFYGNTSNGSGGAVGFDASGQPLTLTGNLFYGNTAVSGSPVVQRGSVMDAITASYNVVDVELGMGDTKAGWTAGTGDDSIGTVFANLPVSGKTFKLLAGSGAGDKLPSNLSALPDYPDTDFYGNPINSLGAAGAVQDTVSGAGYYLDLSVNNSLGGSVTVSASPDADGLYPPGSSLTASAYSGRDFGYWLVNGGKAGTAPTLTDHTKVQAVFTRPVTVNVFTDGSGSATTTGTLRYALTNAEDGDIISMSGGTAGTTKIELGSALPEITKSLTIEGGGVTLTPAASWTASATSQLLRITVATAEVQIRRLHFKDGQATEDGGAIYNTGPLTLESCIFSGNEVTASNVSGGAIRSNNTLTIRGCTFYGNAATNSAAAVYYYAGAKTLTLTGNLFYGNTASQYHLVYTVNTCIPTYNVVDKSYGTGPIQVGWNQGTGDTTFTALSVSGDPFDTTTFVPVSGLQSVLPSTMPAEFPTTDFYGTTRTFPGAPGAVAAP
jgi:hypothetical protein